MSRRPTLPKAPRSDDLPPEGDEVAPAVGDVTYRLLHHLSDTPQDIRDAAALAPLALIKLAQQWARVLAARPTQAVLILAGLAAIVALKRRERR